MSKGKRVTIGYQYFLGWHSILCHGPVDEILEIEADDKVAWQGNVTSSTEIYIDKPELFGGKKKQGGWQGNVDFMFGEDTQFPPNYLSGYLNTSAPSFRGVTSLLFKQFYYSSMTSALKKFNVKVKRIPKWYPEKAEINGRANPIHIVYESMTNPHWGMGEPIGEINDTSYREAADLCFSEGLVLSIPWNQSSSIDSFVDLILKHAGAIRYQSTVDGRWGIKMIRGGYDVSTLPLFDETNITKFESFKRSGTGETVNELTLKYKDDVSGNDKSVTLQNLGSIRQQGAVINKELQFPGIPTQELAARVAMRELNALAHPLATAKIKVNLDGEGTDPGDVIKISWIKKGLVEIPFRVLEVEYPNEKTAGVVLTLIEDVFGLPSSTYYSPGGGLWQPPSSELEPIDRSFMQEAPYYLLANEYGDSYAQSLVEGTTMTMHFAERNSGRALWQSFSIYVDEVDNDNFVETNEGYFNIRATLAEDIDYLTGSFELSGVASNFAAPFFLLIDDEWMYVSAWDSQTNIATVDRAAWDTMPKKHLTNADVWMLREDEFIFDNEERLESQVIGYKYTPAGSSGELDIDLAPENVYTLTGRQGRPLPPAAVRINGEFFPESVEDHLTFNWAHRSRLLQTTSLNVQWDDVLDIGPEPGVSYRIILKDMDDSEAVFLDVGGITNNNYTYSLTQENSDNGILRTNIRAEIYSSTSQGDCLQPFILEFTRNVTINVVGGNFDLSKAINNPVSAWTLTEIIP